MGQLDGLATELLLSVSSFLNQVDLLNLSLTSKLLRSATEPELYREYTNLKKGCRQSEISFKPFIKRLIERPDLRAHVRHLDLRCWSTLDTYNPYHKPEPNPGMNSEEYELFRNAAHDIGLLPSAAPYTKESRVIEWALGWRRWDTNRVDEPWYKHVYGKKPIDKVPFPSKFCHLLRADIEDPLVVLLVALLSNLRAIRIRDFPLDQNTLPWPLSQRHFLQLRKFTAAPKRGMGAWPSAFFGELIQYANLQVLELYCAGEAWASSHDLDPGTYLSMPLFLVPGSLHLTHMTLDRCTFSQTGIACLLGACRGLKNFFYSSSNLIVSTTQLIEALLQHANTLKVLHLDIAPGWVHWQQSSKTITSLADFHALESLYTVHSMWVPLEHDPTNPEDVANNETRLSESLALRIPTSLQHFTIHHETDMSHETGLVYETSMVHGTGMVLAYIRYLLQVREASFPQLHTIKILASSKEWAASYKDLDPNEAVLRVVDHTGVEAGKTFFDRAATKTAWQETRFGNGAYAVEDHDYGHIIVTVKPPSEWTVFPSSDTEEESDEDGWWTDYETEWEADEDEEDEQDDGQE